MHGATSFGGNVAKWAPGTSLRVNVPNRSAIAAIRLQHGPAIVVVPLGFGEHKKVLMCAGRSILNAFRLGIRLVPNYVGTEVPAVILQRESQPPRDAEQVFWFQALWSVGPYLHGACPIFFVGRAPTTISARIAIADVKPKNSIIPQHPLRLGEHPAQAVDELRQSRFVTDLVLDVVIAKPPIGRRGHQTLH